MRVFNVGMRVFCGDVYLNYGYGTIVSFDNMMAIVNLDNFAGRKNINMPFYLKYLTAKSV